jgi:hypothetical protein
MVTAFWLHAGLQTRFRTLDTGFICASAIRYYVSSPILDVDMQGSFIVKVVMNNNEGVVEVGLYEKIFHKALNGRGHQNEGEPTRVFGEMEGLGCMGKDLGGGHGRHGWAVNVWSPC